MSKARANIPLAIFASMVIVGGVVMMAYIASQTSPILAVPSNAPTPQTVTSSGAFLVVAGEGLRKISRGTFSTFRFPEDLKEIGMPISQLQGVRLLTGERVVLDADARIVVASDVLRSPDGRRSLASAPFRADGVGAILIRYGSDAEEVVLRRSDGAPIRSVIPVGWWDERTAAVTGVVTSTRAIFSVALAGTVQQVAFLPDEFDHLALLHGAAWFTTETPGPGLEASPGPPVTLERIDRNGARVMIAVERDTVISSYAVNATGTMAYATTLQEAGGSRGVIIADGRPRPVDGVPLLVLTNGSVLVRRDERKENDHQFILIHQDGTEATVPGMVDLPSDAAVFEILDEIPSNP